MDQFIDFVSYLQAHESVRIVLCSVLLILLIAASWPLFIPKRSRRHSRRTL